MGQIVDYINKVKIFDGGMGSELERLSISYETVEDLNIESLLKRLKENEIEEIIIATNATIEGETTARYIKEIIREFDVKVTRIAHGLPVGGDLSYADEMTVLKALEGRREY